MGKLQLFPESLAWPRSIYMSTAVSSAKSRTSGGERNAALFSAPLLVLTGLAPVGHRVAPAELLRGGAGGEVGGC